MISHCIKNCHENVRLRKCKKLNGSKRGTRKIDLSRIYIFYVIFNALKSISSVYVYSISPVAKSSNLLMSIKYFLLSSFKVFEGIPNTTIQHILTFHLIYFNTLTLEKGELANCQDVCCSSTFKKMNKKEKQYSCIKAHAC